MCMELGGGLQGLKREKRRRRKNVKSLCGAPHPNSDMGRASVDENVGRHWANVDRCSPNDLVLGRRLPDTGRPTALPTDAGLTSVAIRSTGMLSTSNVNQKRGRGSQHTKRVNTSMPDHCFTALLSGYTLRRRRICLRPRCNPCTPEPG